MTLGAESFLSFVMPVPGITEIGKTLHLSDVAFTKFVKVEECLQCLHVGHTGQPANAAFPRLLIQQRLDMKQSLVRKNASNSGLGFMKNRGLQSPLS